MAKVIGIAFDMQKQYGKTTSQIENIVNGFCWVMQSYALEEVVRGVGEYIKRHNDFPTPADIVAIIDPPKPEWKPDKSYYIKLQEIYKREGPYGLDLDEIEYIKKYETFMQKELRDSK